MSVYHQMGHDSKNLLGEIQGFRGAIVSPVNETEADVKAIIDEHQTDDFEFVFDPQLYFPNRADRGKLSTWSYFPKDLETADVSSSKWLKNVLRDLVATTDRLEPQVACSPATIPRAYTDDYYEAMRAVADRTTELFRPKGIRVLQTLIVRIAELAEPSRSLEIASIASGAESDGVYLVVLSDVKPRDELRDVEQLKGIMRLIHALEGAGMPVTVGFSSTDLVLWKAAGATSCATGKYANLRRFTASRFDDEKDGGRIFAYWCEEALLAFLRQSDLVRVQQYGIATETTNPFGKEILAQMKEDPNRAWVGLGWRQYLHWFADIESRLSAGKVQTKDLIRAAEKNWQMLEENDVFMEEKSNDGGWLRPWLRASVEFSKTG